MTRLERWTVWGGTAAVSLTGLGFAGLKYLVPPADEFAVINHPLQPVLLKLHILGAPVLVFGLGLIAARHILPRLRDRAGAGGRSGLVAAAVVVPMIVTGYLIQAVSSVRWLAALGWVHLVLGLVFALAAGGHALAGRARARRAAGGQSFSPWPAKSPLVRGRKARSMASQTVLEKG